MSNMSYCRFENTLADLRDCYEYWEDAESPTEKRAREQMVKLCKDILENCSDYVVEVA